jgi:hypothetical protein
LIQKDGRTDETEIIASLLCLADRIERLKRIPRRDLTKYEKKLLFIANLKLPENAVRYEDWKRRQKEYVRRRNGLRKNRK